jgi:cytochrome c oxidase subunit II
MWRNWIPFWQPGVSSYGGDIDLLFIGLLAISLAVALLLFILLLVFAIRYRAGSKADRSHPVRKTWYWEIGWTTLTLLGFLGLFVWGASLYLDVYRDTPDAMPIYVVAKQWMWHVQHQGGQREINELHIPVHRSVQLIMASQDVIHSFFVPAFRVKHDVVPGRYQNLWFRADKTGEFQLLCAEFCGTDHSRMIGRIVVMEPHDFETWLSHQQAPGTLAREGADLFRQLGCSGCHVGQGTVRAPALDGLFGKPVPLQDGTVVVADDRYIRDSILMPASQVAAGYAPVMPSFAGRVSEDELIRLVAYIKSLSPEAGLQE